MDIKKDAKAASVYKCADCGAEVTADDPPAWCPTCGSVNIGYDRD